MGMWTLKTTFFAIHEKTKTKHKLRAMLRRMCYNFVWFVLVVQEKKMWSQFSNFNTSWGTAPIGVSEASVVVDKVVSDVIW